ncbi:hypothetical protein [Nonomuraea sp. SYSU D8015]|uniref:hypothetical protein n=1 Tax=Nonomuraea sp. SYSU D8015 TaxID=2593644 RepID=UPI001660BC60|nr:hypothetical protein [Nonomuraea sp. SYSU D8015]
MTPAEPDEGGEQIAGGGHDVRLVHRCRKARSANTAAACAYNPLAVSSYPPSPVGRRTKY